MNVLGLNHLDRSQSVVLTVTRKRSECTCVADVWNSTILLPAIPLYNPSLKREGINRHTKGKVYYRHVYIFNK